MNQSLNPFIIAGGNIKGLAISGGWRCQESIGLTLKRENAMVTVKVLDKKELEKITDFWVVVFSSLELLDNIIINEAKKNKEDEKNILEIRGDINRAMITAKRKHSVAMKAMIGDKTLH